MEKQVLDGLKTGNEALKKANEMFSIEEIEQIMDDTAEAVEKVKLEPVRWLYKPRKHLVKIILDFMPPYFLWHTLLITLPT